MAAPGPSQTEPSDDGAMPTSAAAHPLPQESLRTASNPRREGAGAAAATQKHAAAQQDSSSPTHDPDAVRDGAPAASPDSAANADAPDALPMHNLDRAIAAAAAAAGDVLLPGQPPVPPPPPLCLRSIRLEGMTTLRPSFLAQLCRPYVDPRYRSTSVAAVLYGDLPPQLAVPGAPTSLASLLATASAIANHISSLDLYANLDATLVPSQQPGADDESDVDVVLRASKPRSRLFLKSSTDVGNLEGSASVQARIRNALGGAETLEATYGVGTRTRTAWRISSYASQRDVSAFVSCASELSRGVRFALVSSLAGGSVSHEVAYELGETRMGRLLRDASLSLRRSLHPSPRSSLLHSVSYNSLDAASPLECTVGWAGRWVAELGGLGLGGADAPFFKLEAEARTARAVGYSGWAWTASGRAGVLRTLARQPSRFTDRFFLGGPTSLRSVRYNGLGPRDMADSLGGDAYWSAGVSVFAPLLLSTGGGRPSGVAGMVLGEERWRRWARRSSEWPVKLHGWINAGQLVGVEQGAGHRRALRSALPYLAQPTCTAGVGLAMTQGPLRVELNFGVPLVAHAGDAVRKGWQLGIGVDFL